MKTPAPADLHRWSEELARNPASLAFLPLARAYRRLGRRDLALQLCLRGLDQHPTHVEAHTLLALLYFEAGERAKAADEWATVLRLKPGNFEALRGMGFRHLEQGDITRARQHLERAALIRPDDTTVQEALRLIRQREAASATRPPSPPPLVRPRLRSPAPGPAARARAPTPGSAQAGRPHSPATPPSNPASRPAEIRPQQVRPQQVRPPQATPPAGGPRPTQRRTPPNLPFEPLMAVPSADRPDDSLPEIELEPWAEDAPAGDAVAHEPWKRPEPPPAAPVRPAAPSQPAPRPPAFEFAGTPAPSAALPDPTGLFESLMGQGPILGVLLLDRGGLVLAGRLQEARVGVAEDLGAILGGAIEEALRAVQHLDLGKWRGLLLECETAMLHVAPAPGEALLVVAARREAPTGWIVRTAAHAATLAAPFAEVYS
jgi:predicted regulator of Ras-like GTPase activity (Roadblock/LC7/MglB family)